jgi:curved DNA-binding protein CbpA
VFSKDYYQILSVMPNAEGIVIRAAYKALAQRYHPDKFQGDPVQSGRVMKEINEAYSVLSDPAQKAQYDAWYQDHRKQDEFVADDAQDEELADALNAYEKDWKLACDIYPELRTEFDRLNKVAHRLALTYKILLLESKQFANRNTLAASMENDFFKAYFGNNPMIVMFAREIVLAGYKKAAKALNEYIRVLGPDAEGILIIDRIRESYNIPDVQKIQDEKTMKGIQDKINSRANLSAADRKFISYKLNVSENHLSRTYTQCSKCGYFGPVELYEDKKRGFFTGSMYRCPVCKNSEDIFLR